MEAATEAVNTAGGKPGDTVQRSESGCTLLVICIGILTAGCLASVGTIIFFCSVSPSPAGYPPAPPFYPPKPASPDPNPRGNPGVPSSGNSQGTGASVPHAGLPFERGHPGGRHQGTTSPTPAAPRGGVQHDWGDLIDEVLGGGSLRLFPFVQPFGSLANNYHADTGWHHGGTTGGAALRGAENYGGDFDRDHERTTGGRFAGGPGLWGTGPGPTGGTEPFNSATSSRDADSEDEQEDDAGDGSLGGVSVDEARWDGIIMTKDTTPPTTYSQVYFLPHADVDVLIHGPSTAPGEMTPLYEKKPERVFCFVIAGTETLGITGGGVNGAMAELLVYNTIGHTTKSHLADVTQTIHSAAVDLAKRNPGVLQSLDMQNLGIYDQVFSFYGEKFHPLPGVEDTVGVAVLGRLKKEYFIYGEPRNTYLLYIVSPKGTAPDASFRKAYAATWRNLITLVAEVNRNWASLGVEKIEQLRVPLLSGGIYRSHRPRDMLAKIAVTELLAVARRAGAGFLLDFMYDSEQSFFHAIRSTVAK